MYYQDLKRRLDPAVRVERMVELPTKTPWTSSYQNAVASGNRGARENQNVANVAVHDIGVALASRAALRVPTFKERDPKTSVNRVQQHPTPDLLP